MLSGTGGDCSAIGYKIACTSEFARQLFDADGPVFGRLLSCQSWPGSAVLPASRFPGLAVEPEFAFRMAEDVPDQPCQWTGEAIIPYVEGMLPAIEIVGRRFADWSAYSATSLAADNAVNMGWVHGEATGNWRNVDLALHPVSLFVNGKEHLSGSGANVMGSPLNALAWLANELPVHGLGLRAGDVVTTGVCTDIHPSGPGESVTADFGVLGEVSVTFTG